MKKTFNSSIVSKDTDKKVFSFLQQIRKKITDLENGTLSFHYGGRPVRAQKCDIIRVISSTNVSNTLELGIRNIVLEAVLSSETLSAGSGYLLLRRFFSKKDNSFKTESPVEINDVKHSVRTSLGLGVCNNIVNRIVEEASIDARVTISNSQMASFPVITVSHLLEIEGEIAESFRTKRKSLEGSAVLFVDGVIESLGMIDSVLQSFFREKKSLVIFARGYAPDVLSTLDSNFNKGSLFVFPIKVFPKEEAFEKVLSHEKYFNIENIDTLRSLSVDDFNCVYNISFLTGLVAIEGIESTERKAHVTLPERYRSMKGLIQDRVDIGKRIALETARTGIGRVDNSAGTFSKMSILQSKLSCESLRNSLERIGVFVLQE